VGNNSAAEASVVFTGFVVVSSPLCVINKEDHRCIASQDCRPSLVGAGPDRRSRPTPARAQYYVCSPLVVASAPVAVAQVPTIRRRDLLRTPVTTLCAAPVVTYSARRSCHFTPADHVVLATHAGRHYAAPAAAYVAPGQLLVLPPPVVSRLPGTRRVTTCGRLFRPRVYSATTYYGPGRTPAYSGRALLHPLYYRY